MHEKVEHLFAQKNQRQNELPIPLLIHLLQMLFNLNFSIPYLQSKLSTTLIVTFDF